MRACRLTVKDLVLLPMEMRAGVQYWGRWVEFVEVVAIWARSAGKVSQAAPRTLPDGVCTMARKACGPLKNFEP